MKRLVLCLFSVFVFAALPGCGGGGGGNKGGGGGGGGGSAPTISISPTSAITKLVDSTVFALTVSGSSDISCDDSDPNFGSVTVSGSSVTYRANPPASQPLNSKPSVWNPAVNCTARNSHSETSASAQITLHYPTSTITEVTPRKIRCQQECAFGPLVVRGSGFYPGGTIQFNDDAPMQLPADVAFDQASFVLGFDTAHYNPGFNKVVISSPAEGHGGGNSNAGYFAFLGGGNTLAVDRGEAFVLDPAGIFTRPDGTTGQGVVHVFDIVSGNKLREFWVGALVIDIAVDNLTGNIILAKRTLVVVRDRNSGETVSGVNPENLVTAVAGRAGRVCLSEGNADKLASFDVAEQPELNSNTTIGDEPSNVVVAELPSDGLTCSTFNVGDGIFSVVVTPEMRLLRFLHVSEITLRDQLVAGAGGWQLVAFHSGSYTGIAALFAQTDDLVVFVDLRSGHEIRRVKLEGRHPFGIAADETNGKLVVALADFGSGGGRFITINPTDGAITELASGASFLVKELAISPDGTKIHIVGKEGNALFYATLDNR